MPTQQQYPRIVRNGSVHAIAVMEQHDNVMLLCLDATKAIYTAIECPALSLKRTWDDVDEFNKIGRKTPTVEHYLDHMSRSAFSIDRAALKLLNHLKENAVPHVVYVSPKGEIMQEKSEGAIVLDVQRPVAEAVQELETLSERALGAFVSNALALDKALARIKRGDKRISEALAAALKQTDQKAATNVAKAATKALNAKGNTAAAKDDDTPADSNKPARKAVKKVKNSSRGPSVKMIVYTHLQSGKRATPEQLLAMCPQGTTLSTVKTALADIKNPKYAPDGKALKVEKDKATDTYYVAK